MGVTGAYFGTPLSLAATAFGLWWISRARLGAPAPGAAARRLRDLVGGAWPAVVGLFLVALLQNVDVILVKRQIGGDAAGAYAAAAVAAKAVVWVAIGIGLYLLPEATRAARHGLDPRPVLARALGVVAAVAVPMLIVYGLFPSTVLRLAFGSETVVAADALFVLACAMTLLAVGYLGVQYMLALGRVAFLPALAVVAVAELALLSTIGSKSLVVFAACVLALQAAAALSVLAIGLAPSRAAPRVDRGLAHGRAGRAAAVRGAGRRGLRVRVVEIGSFRGKSTVELARAAGSVVAIDPHAGSDRGPQEIKASASRGEADVACLSREPGGGRRGGPGAPRAQVLGGRAWRRGRTALAAVRRRGASLRPGPRGSGRAGAGAWRRAGRCSSTTRSRRSASPWRCSRCALSGEWHYLGRTGSLAEYTRAPSSRWRELAAHLRELPWFARNVAIKVLVVAGRRSWAERLGLGAGRPMALLSARMNSATPATATQWTAIRSIEYSGL